jgi:hypothetical protein
LSLYRDRAVQSNPHGTESPMRINKAVDAISRIVFLTAMVTLLSSNAFAETMGRSISKASGWLCASGFSCSGTLVQLQTGDLWCEESDGTT